MSFLFSAGLRSTIPDSQGYLYNQGEFETAWVEGFSLNTGSVSKEADHLFTRGGPDTSGDAIRTWRTDDSFDLTNYSQVEYDWEPPNEAGNTEFYVDSGTGTKGANADAANRFGFNGGEARTTDTIDVSGLSGEYYIYTGSRDGSTTSGRNADLRTYAVQLIK